MRSGLEWRYARALGTEYAVSAVGLVYGSRLGDRRVTQVRPFKTPADESESYSYLGSLRL